MKFAGDVEPRDHAHVLDWLINEGRKDRHRPWLKQTTGGWLVFMVLATTAGGVLVDFVLR